MSNQERGIWIFGYGSIMWKQNFVFNHKEDAILNNHERDYCILTERHRGEPSKEGLVLGARHKENNSCKGAAFYIPDGHIDETIKYLEKRENGEFENLYYRKDLLIWLCETQRWQKAQTFIANEMHPSFVGHWKTERKAETILNAKGESGSNLEYFKKTYESIKKLSAQEHHIENLNRLLSKNNL